VNLRKLPMISSQESPLLSTSRAGSWFSADRITVISRARLRFLAVLWRELPPPPRKPNSAKEFVKRARNLAGGTVSWSRGERCNFRGILEA